MKLHYFDVYGRGEAIRMVLNHKGVAFEDNRITFDQWPALKAGMPGGVVPALELDDGTRYGQSVAILRYVGRVNGYYSDDAVEALHIDQIVDDAVEVLGQIYKPHFAEDKEALYPALFDVAIPKLLNSLESRFASGEWLVGNRLTIADFAVGQVYINYVANPAITFGQDRFAAVLEQFPNFKAYGEKFVAENKAHLDARPPRPI